MYKLCASHTIYVCEYIHSLGCLVSYALDTSTIIVIRAYLRKAEANAFWMREHQHGIGWNNFAPRFRKPWFSRRCCHLVLAGWPLWSVCKMQFHELLCLIHWAVVNSKLKSRSRHIINYKALYKYKLNGFKKGPSRVA